VVAYLVETGIDPSRLRAQGKGEVFPVAPNDTLEGKARNRRVELTRVEEISRAWRSVRR
jgi:outer membrane protein OmpA-like peptidoglycan-associated protein